MENAELVNPKSLVRISKVAQALGKSAAWVHAIAKRGDLNTVVIDECHFVRVDFKLRALLPGKF